MHAAHEARRMEVRMGVTTRMQGRYCLGNGIAVAST